MTNILNKARLLLFGLLPLLNVATASESQPKTSQPNILLILSDDHAKKALSCYGNTDIQTPALDRIAREGMRFNHALTPNSFCTPSRAVVLTGKYSHKNGVTHLNQSFDGSQQTFPKLLQAAGYQTSLFGKWHLLSQPTGFDFYCVQKMQGMAFDPIVFETGTPWIPWSAKDRKSYKQGGRQLKGYNNDAITTEALRWLKETRDPNKPFCMLLHPKPPHQPYKPPMKYEDFLKDVEIPEPATLLDDYQGRTPEAIQDIMSANRLVLGPAFKDLRSKLEKANPRITRDELTRAIYQEYIKGYYRLVKSVDDNVGRVLDYLDESGLDKNTLVIYTSDQGFSLGEHGFYNKQWMYEGPLHQPLLVRFPGAIKPGTVHDSMVSHVDLAPTLLDYAGLPVPNDMQGHSLKPILEGKAGKVCESAYYHFYEHGSRLPEMIGIRTETHKLIHYPGMKASHQWELFDLQNDPEEMSNLYGSSEHRETRESLKRELRTLIKKLDDPVEAPALMKAPQKKGNSAALGEAPAKPNVILIMADDIAYDNLGCYGSEHFKTPRLDELARTGIKFNYCYSEPVCTPSRVKIMTGRDNIRNYTQFGRLDPKETTFGTMMKEAGYATAIAGKWQLHENNGALAPGCGFDTFCLWNYPGTERPRYWNPSLIRDGKKVPTTEDSYGPDICTDFLVEFIENNKDRPFFAYYPMISVHSPFLPTPDSRDRQNDSAAENYRDMVSYMDKCVGKIGNPREWTFQYYYPKNKDAAKKHCAGKPYIIWAQDQHYKLYSHGKFIQVKDRHEQTNISPGTGTPEAEAARKKLQAAIDSMPKKVEKKGPGVKDRKVKNTSPAKNGDLKSGDRPNIVLMMSDDQGWGETGYNGHPHLKTPVLDEMAASGLRLDRFYAASPVCTPTRASVLTGRHANRSGAFGAGWSIRPEEVTLAPILKAAGYRTAHFGKWHVGAIKKGSPLSPKRLGFDESQSHDNFFELNPELSRNGKPAERIEGESSEILVKEALAYAAKSRSADKPFFIVIWFGSPHSPYESLENDRAPYKQLGEELSHRLGEIAAMDRAIGMFRDGLDDLGEQNNTLLWFNSDNGITKEGIPKQQQAELFKGCGLRGHKSQMYEGGLRVPGIIEWPAIISAARSSSVPCVTSDIMPTLLDILDIKHPNPQRPLDGISLKTLIVDGTMKSRPTPIGFWGYDWKPEQTNKPWLANNASNEMITMTAKQKATLVKRPDAKWYFKNHKHPVAKTSFGGNAAWIDGRYKLMVSRGKKTNNYELYDLEADRGESNNIASRHPEKVNTMVKQLNVWQQSVENSLTGADYAK